MHRAALAAGVARVVSFGEHGAADARLDKLVLHADCSTVAANILGLDVTYKVGAPGRHLVLNSLAVLATVSVLGADLALAALALADLRPPAGRGARQTLTVLGGTAVLIDESYNANPASMRAALALLGQMEMVSRGRRIAVLGDMLELGPRGGELHSALVEPVLAHDIDLVFCCGPQMRRLWEALPPERRGGYAETAAALEPAILGNIHAGDAVMVKGSLGSKMGPIVTALTRKFSSQRPVAAAAQG
jgi:UDP-N-acetylmuramoyl-tripeptide--D-alanyl-D-alanine ligase